MIPSPKFQSGTSRLDQITIPSDAAARKRNIHTVMLGSWRKYGIASPRPIRKSHRLDMLSANLLRFLFPGPELSTLGRLAKAEPLRHARTGPFLLAQEPGGFEPYSADEVTQLLTQLGVSGRQVLTVTCKAAEWRF